MNGGSTARVVTALLLSFAVVSLSAGQSAPAGCGPPEAKHKTTVHRDKHPTPSPAPGKALIYFIRNQALARAWVQAKLGVGGRWIGVLPRGDNYMFADIEPGVVKLCINYRSSREARPEGFVFLTAEAGKIYYFETMFTTGFNVGYSLVEVDEKRGAALVSESRFVTFEEDR